MVVKTAIGIQTNKKLILRTFAAAISVITLYLVGTQQMASAFLFVSDTTLPDSPLFCTTSTSAQLALSRSVTTTDEKLIIATLSGFTNPNADDTAILYYDLVGPGTNLLDYGQIDHEGPDTGDADDRNFAVSGISTASGSFQVRILSVTLFDEVCLVDGNSDLRIIYE